jgi:hypothetical protein
MQSESFSTGDTFVDTELQTPAGSVAEEKQLEAEQLHAAMRKELRSSAWWLIGMGALSLVASGIFDASFGVLLIVIGLAFFLVKDATMFVLFGVAMAWAAVTNAAGAIGAGEWGWVVLSILQVYWTARLFMDYVRFRPAQANWAPKACDSRADHPGTAGIDQAFPVVGCGLSALALFGVVAMSFAMVVVLGMAESNELPTVYGFGMGLVVDFAVLSLAVSLASLLSRFRLKILSILGVAGSALVLLSYLVLAAVGS